MNQAFLMTMPSRTRLRSRRSRAESQEHVHNDHDHRADAVGEQGCDRVAADPITVVLEAVDLDPWARV
jgi:hypothetical protein